MPRMIVSRSDLTPAVGGQIAAAGAGPAGPGVVAGHDQYMDRVAKYIPGEVVVLYLGLLASSAAAPGGPTLTLLWTIFVICLIATPAYLLVKFNKEKSTLGLRLKLAQILISTIAFVLWAWALQDPTALHIVNPFWGRFLLPIFSFAVGLYEP
jgi:hypothetical protein